MTRLTAEQVLKDKQTRDISSITSLSLTHKALFDVSCLSEFKKLERLDLASNNLTSLEGLRSCVNLKWLSVVENKLQSLNGIESFSKLTVLNAGKNKLKSMYEVRSLLSLRALILNDNEIVSICGLDQMKELNTLVLSRNPIHEIGQSLVKLKSVTKLSLSNCHLQAIDSSLKSCTELRELRLAHNDIKTLPTELAYNKKLQNLDMGNNVITRWSDLKVLSSLLVLKNLNLLGNPIAEKDKLTKKVQKLLPNLHVFNARPIDKSIKNGNTGTVGTGNDFSLIPDNKLQDHKKEKKSSKQERHQSKSGHLENAANLDKQKQGKIRAKISEKEEVPVYGKDVTMAEKKLQRKRSQEGQDNANDLGMKKDLKQKKKKTNEKVMKKNAQVDEDDNATVEKKPKNEKSLGELGELDIIDNGEISFAELLSVGAVENLKHGGEKRNRAVEEINSSSTIVTLSAKKRKSKGCGAGPTVQLSPAVEIGMGGPSTWDDE